MTALGNVSPMSNTITQTLAPGLKIELVHGLLSGHSLQKTVEQLSTEEIASAVRFVFAQTIEFGILTLGKELPQEELLLTGHQFNLPPAADCQQAHTCKPLECVPLHHDCARSRLIVQIERLSQLARALLQSTS
jgi:hypothetical protein